MISNLKLQLGNRRQRWFFLLATLIPLVTLISLMYKYAPGASATWFDDPIELLLPLMVYVHASEERVYGAGNFAYRKKITIGNTGAADRLI